MNLPFTRPFACLAALLLGACSTPPTHQVAVNYRPDAAAGQGVVVGSIGVRGTRRTPPWLDWSRYEYRSLVDASRVGQLTSAYTSNPFYMFGTMPLCADDGLEAECGQLFALQLPAGDYEFHRVYPAMMQLTSDRSFRPAGWDHALGGYRFTVRAGEVFYLGNLLSRICTGGQSKHHHGNQVWSAVGATFDRYERDLPLLLLKYPQFAGLEIGKALLPGDPWVWRFQRSAGQTPPYGWPPDCSAERALEYLAD